MAHTQSCSTTTTASSSATNQYVLTVLGCGSSASTPKLGCIITGRTDCSCIKSLADPYNRRLNPSIALSRRRTGEQPHQYFNVLIDAGKTFREGALLRFRAAELTHIDACVLTHGHMDAMGGVDDLREVQLPTQTLEVFMDDPTAKVVVNMYPYLFPGVRHIPRHAAHYPDDNNNIDDDGKSGVVDGLALLYVAKLRPWLMESFQSFQLDDDRSLTVTPIPMHHGSCIAQGFAFKHATSDTQTVYLSDFRCMHATTAATEENGVPEVTDDDIGRLTCFVDVERSLEVLRQWPIRHLFVDSLHLARSYVSHSSFDETCKLVTVLDERYGVRPQHVWLTGLSCSNDYHDLNRRLADIFPRGHVKCAHDGLELKI